MDNPTSQVAVPEQAALFGPFSLIVNPQAVFDAMQRSERLQGLHRRIYRPLGHPPAVGREAAERDAENTAFDTSLEEESNDFGHTSVLTK
jgi:hypothetical protein